MARATTMEAARYQDTRDRLAVFDEKTRKVIEKDMIKMQKASENRRNNRGKAQKMDRIEKQISNMATSEDEIFQRIYRQIQQKAADNDKKEPENLADLMNDAEEERKPIETIRQRRQPEAPSKPKPIVPRLQATVTQRPADHDGPNLRYIVPRILLLAFILFIVPFAQWYFWI